MMNKILDVFTKIILIEIVIFELMSLTYSMIRIMENIFRKEKKEES